MVAAAAAGVAGAKYAKDNPDQAKVGALILLVGGLILFNKISGTLEGFGDFGKGALEGFGDLGKGALGKAADVGDAVVRGTEKTGDAVGNVFEGMFTGAETDYKIDVTIAQPLGGASADYLSTFEGMEYEDFITAKGNKPSYVPGKYVAGGDYAYNFSTPLAIVTTANKPGGGEAFGGSVHDYATGIYTEPILDIPFTDITVIPSFKKMGGAVKGLFR